MCLVCVDLIKGSMTPKEARRALTEYVVKLEPEHVAEVLELIGETERGEDAGTPRLNADK